MTFFNSWIKRYGGPLIIPAGLLLVALIGMVDYWTGYEWYIAVFYLIPIVLASWRLERNAGILISLASALTWFITETVPAGRIFSHPLIPYWNSLVLLVFFLVVVFAISALKAARKKQEEMMQFIVHDLRSPLTNTIEGLNMLKEISAETMNKTQKELMEVMIVSVNRLLTLINTLLDLSRLENGEMPLEIAEVNIRNLVASAVGEVSLWAQRNDVQIVVRLEAAPENICADGLVTRRILVNLLSNAIKFSPSNTTITVEAKVMEFGMIAFSVMDEGPGIPAQWVKKLFHKFAQVEARKTGIRSGTGLGLSFCRLAVEAQGGRIWLEPGAEKGTKVVFTLQSGRLPC